MTLAKDPFDTAHGGCVLETAPKKPKYNLNYRIGPDLREMAEDPKSMLSYVEFMIAEVKFIPAPPPSNRVRPLVKFLGEIGAYAKILRKPEVAVRALEHSLSLIDLHNLGARTWAIHTLRYGDALRFQGDRLGAETAFRSVLEMGTRSPEVAELRDFAFQHLGKLFFDFKEMKPAEECFTKALEIRKRLGVKELIDSTELALRVLKMKADSKGF